MHWSTNIGMSFRMFIQQYMPPIWMYGVSLITYNLLNYLHMFDFGGDGNIGWFNLRAIVRWHCWISVWGLLAMMEGHGHPWACCHGGKARRYTKAMDQPALTGFVVSPRLMVYWLSPDGSPFLGDIWCVYMYIDIDVFGYIHCCICGVFALSYHILAWKHVSTHCDMHLYISVHRIPVPRSAFNFIKVFI